MNEIQGGRWDRMLRRMFSMKGERAVAPTLSPEIVPYVAIESPDDPKNGWLRGERIMGASNNIAAVAAQIGQAELRNPLGSGTIITCLEVNFSWFGAGAGFDVRVGVPAVGGTLRVKGIRDLRWDGNAGGANIQQSVGQILTLTTAVLIGVRIAHQSTLGRPAPPYTHPIVLPPGYSVFGDGVVVNTQFDVGFVWTERAMEPSEQ